MATDEKVSTFDCGLPFDWQCCFDVVGQSFAFVVSLLALFHLFLLFQLLFTGSFTVVVAPSANSQDCEDRYDCGVRSCSLARQLGCVHNLVYLRYALELLLSLHGQNDEASLQYFFISASLWQLLTVTGFAETRQCTVNAYTHTHTHNLPRCRSSKLVNANSNGKRI